MTVFDKTGENYSLNNVNYDANGNITNLSRNGWKSNNTFGLIDDLNYTYNTNSNKILKVDDASSDIASFKDISGNDYTYWEDGSLKSDANKGITLIEYNHLKLPRKITFSNSQTIDYQYDATGKKLREKAKDGTWTDYIGNLIYKANSLYQIGIDEGRINAQNQYEFGIQDHLGNVRVMFRDSLGIAKITQIENFGAWGESLNSINYSQSPATQQKFVYTGHERNEELGVYDAKARVYDPIVPRMWQIDPLAEKWNSYSPYNYVLNNPILFSDSDGRDIDFSKIKIENIGGKGESRYKVSGQVTINVSFVNMSNTKVNMKSLANDFKTRSEKLLSGENFSFLKAMGGVNGKKSKGENLFIQSNLKVFVNVNIVESSSEMKKTG